MKIASIGSDFYDEGYSDGEDDEKQGLENRITFPQHRLYGRSEEVEKLTHLYQSLGNTVATIATSTKATTHTDAVCNPPFVVITGYPGAGKSTLVSNFVRNLDDESQKGVTPQFFFISGKYNHQNNRSSCDHPFSAIIHAFDSFFVRFMKEGTPEEIKKLRTSIQAALGDEMQSLMAVVPGLAKLIEHRETSKGCNANPQEDDVGDNNDIAPKKDAWNQFKYLFQSLIKAISSPEFGRPTILFLDNVHLADETSLDLLSVFVRDKTMTHLMVICSIQYMLDNNHPVKRRFESLEGKRNFDRIEVNNLSLEDINYFVADALELDRNETLPLSKVVYSQTRGNMFFAMTFLEEMHRKNILYLSVISFQWEWKLEAASELEAELSSDMLEVIVRKIKELPELLQRALVIASYTRSMVALQTLEALMDCHEASPIESVHEFKKLMDRAVNEGLLKMVDSGTTHLCYRFAHDQIQQAAMSIVPAGAQRDNLKVSIALRLKELASKQRSEEGWMLFVAADYLNSIASEIVQPLCLATLNRDCGKKAFGIGGFQSAAQYFRKGLKALQQLDQPWESHYALSLSLFRANSEVELCLSNFDTSADLSLEILRNCKTLEDKKPTYLNMAYIKGEQGKHGEALQICLDALGIYNEFPKRFQAIHMMADLRKVRKYFEMQSDAFFLQLPPMKDSTVRSTMELLQAAAGRAYVCDNIVQFLLGNLRMIRLSLEHGLCARTGHALAGYAAYLSYAGHQNDAVRMARLCWQVLNRCKDSKRAESPAIFVVSAFIDCWTSPIEKLLKALTKAQKSSMECGDLEAALIIRISLFRFMLHGGYPLSAVKKFGAETIGQIELYHIDAILPLMKEAFLPLDYLLCGKSKCNWDDLETQNFEVNSKDEKFRLIYHYIARLYLGVFFGNLEFSKRMVDKLDCRSKSDSLYLNIIQRLFLSGLTFSRLSRQSGKRKHLNRSRRYAEKLRQLIYAKGTTCLFLLNLMDADILAASSGKHDEIQASFDIAIAMALEAGHIQYAALGNEIAGDFFFTNRNESLAKAYLSDSRLLYKEWQAFAKVDELAIKYPTVCTPELEDVDDTSRLMEEIGRYQRRIPFDLAQLPGHVPHELQALL